MSPAALINIWGNDSKSWPPLTNPLSAVYSWVCAAWGFIRGTARQHWSLSPAGSLFVLLKETLASSSAQVDTRLRLRYMNSAHCCGMQALIEGAAWLSTWKHRWKDRISPHPHKYQQTQWWPSWRQESKPSPPVVLLSLLHRSPGCQVVSNPRLKWPNLCKFKQFSSREECNWTHIISPRNFRYGPFGLAHICTEQMQPRHEQNSVWMSVFLRVQFKHGSPWQ